MRAKDVMTVPVVTVGPATSVREIVTLLLERLISGVPVVDDGRIVGEVGEGDLLHRHEIGTEGATAPPTWVATPDFLRPAAGRLRQVARGPRRRHHEPRADRGDRRHAARQIAQVFEARQIRRVPVLRGTQLVGVVTRSDLVRALAGRIPAVDASQAPSDEAIRVRLRAELERQPWWQAKWSTVLVTDGMVRYLGVSDGQADRQAARVAAESIAGVRGVRDDRLEFADWQPMVV